VKMQLTDEAWHVVKGTPKVTGFVGGSKVPPSISEDEVRKITHQIEEGTLKPKTKVEFEKGESVKVTTGPFANFSGVVDTVNGEKGKLRVLVSIFGRSTPIEIDFTEVEKIT